MIWMHTYIYIYIYIYVNIDGLAKGGVCIAS